jgi:hypothetical protein
MAKATPQSSEPATVYAALLRAREEFQPVVKSETADVGKFTYKYVDLGTVLAAVTPALTKHGLILVQTVDFLAHNVVLLTRLVHVDSGTDIVSGYPLQPAKPNDPQALGSAITYARRYAILALLGLAPEDDDAQQASKPAHRQPPTTADNRPADHSRDKEEAGALRTLGQAKTLAELRQLWSGLPQHLREDSVVIRGKDALKKKLGKEAA